MAAPEIPADIILPDPETQKEVDLYRTLQDDSNAVHKALEAVGDDEFVKASSSGTAGYLDAIVDDSTIEVNANVLQVKALGVDTAQLAADSVDKTIINADVAGDGLTQAAGGELDVNVDDSTIETNTDTVRVKADGINDTHIRLSNNTYMRARNAANSADINVIKVNASDVPVIPDGTETATNAAPTSDNDVSNKKYVDDQVATISSGLTLESTNTFSGVTNVSITIADNENYLLIIRGDEANTSTYTGSFRFDASSSSVYRYVTRVDELDSTPAEATVGGSAAAEIRFLGTDTVTQNNGFSIRAFITTESTTQYGAMIEGTAFCYASSTNKRYVFMGHTTEATTTSVDLVRYSGTGTITGEYWLYKYAGS